MTECPGLDLDGDYCDGCGYPVCCGCFKAHVLPGGHLCQPCAEECGGQDLAEELESSAAYVVALANLRADPSLANLTPGEEDPPPTPEECAEAGSAFVNGTVDAARCEQCGGPACTHCEAHLTAGPHAPCADCGRRLIHVLNPAEIRR
ncbi:hypothetical protein ACFYN3_39485 [Streptomyces lavendulae]|uniref:hypothetical protein n=1 Tax=Streptomyces lavendulae TaxID=1914 RepID=UPI0036892D46